MIVHIELNIHKGSIAHTTALALAALFIQAAVIAYRKIAEEDIIGM